MKNIITLIADDDSFNIKSLIVTLSRMNIFKFYEAYNGKQAIEIL